MSARRDPRIDPHPGDRVVVDWHAGRNVNRRHVIRVTEVSGDRITYVNALGATVERDLSGWRAAALGGRVVAQEVGE